MNNYVTKEELDTCLKSYHENRWRGLIVWIVVVTVLLFFGFRSIHERTQEGKDSRTALCLLRDSLQKSNNDSRDFLDQHPAGIRGADGEVLVSGTQLSRQIRDRQRTIDQLAILKCGPYPGQALRY